MTEFQYFSSTHTQQIAPFRKSKNSRKTYVSKEHFFIVRSCFFVYKFDIPMVSIPIPELSLPRCTMHTYFLTQFGLLKELDFYEYTNSDLWNFIRAALVLLLLIFTTTNKRFYLAFISFPVQYLLLHTPICNIIATNHV